MCRLLLFIGIFCCSFLRYEYSYSQSSIPAVCNNSTIELASCGSESRQFKSVLVAIHGWNGDCKSTFGRTDSNILKIVKAGGFFDIDCFGYNTDDVTLNASRDRLKVHMQKLGQVGYTEFAFITHSTGGVLALDFILREAINSQGDGLKSGGNLSFIFDKEKLKLSAFHAWGIPINGARIGRIIPSLIWNNSRVLPDLAPNSQYLNSLISRFKSFDTYFAASEDNKPNYIFDMTFLQGQKWDFVVKGIDKKNDEWVPKELDFDLITTNTGHLFTVGRSGESGIPSFPAAITASKLQNQLSLRPRFSPFFEENNTPYSNLEKHQKRIIDGIVGHAGRLNFLPNSLDVIADLITRVRTY